MESSSGRRRPPEPSAAEQLAGRPRCFTSRFCANVAIVNPLTRKVARSVYRHIGRQTTWPCRGSVSLSDFSINSTVVLVGVSDTIGHLVADHPSIVRAISQIFLRRMLPLELKAILDNAEQKLGIQFTSEASQLIIHISQGLPHYTHLIGLHAVRVAAKAGTAPIIDRSNVFRALDRATTEAEQSTRDRHTKATHSAHKEALYRPILLACAVAAAREQDPLGYFTPASVVSPLSTILDRYVEIATFNSHLNAFCQSERGNVLERDGMPRAYRFRFHDPMVVPFVFMDAVSIGIIDENQMASLLND